MYMQLRAFLATAMFLGMIGLTTDAWGLTATQLGPPAKDHFQQYRETPHALGYRAFAIESESGKWGRSTSRGTQLSAITQSIEDCRRRAARDCEIYAVGDIVVHGLADWKVQVATMLYRVKRSATNDDLEAISTMNGGTAIAALRRSVFHTGAKLGSTGAVVAMLDRGIDVNARSAVGATALLYAASRARHEVVALLLKRGANVNTRNNVGETALGMVLLAQRFARLRNYRMAEYDAVIRLLKDAGGRG